MAASAILAGVSIWTYVYMASSIARAKTALVEVKQEIISAEAERKEARSLKKTLEERDADIARINKFIINRQSPIEFIEELENLARRTQNSIILDVQNEKNGPDLSFRLTLEGSQDSVTKYLRALELLPYEIQVEDIAYQRVSSDPRVAGSSAFSRLILSIKVKAGVRP